jgi:hypothetical protein
LRPVVFVHLKQRWLVGRFRRLRFCVKVAQDEVNGMADFKVKIDPIRKGGKLRGTVTGFRVSWWRKNQDELKEAFQEINRPKVGRLARLRANEQPAQQIILPPLPVAAE